MAPNLEQDFEARVEHVVARILARHQRDVWHDAQSAADYLRMSKSHFLKLGRTGKGPQGRGYGRLRRWRRTVLDQWLEGRSDA
jgi:hypothetical protein